MLKVAAAVAGVPGLGFAVGRLPRQPAQQPGTGAYRAALYLGLRVQLAVLSPLGGLLTGLLGLDGNGGFAEDGGPVAGPFDAGAVVAQQQVLHRRRDSGEPVLGVDRKSTRLNSS